MKHLVRVILVALLCLQSMHTSIAQWTAKNIPYGSWINCLAVKDTCLFAGTDTGGVFRSSDNGDNWTLTSSGLPSGQVFAMVSKDTSLFATVGGQGVFRSTNDGDTWIGVNTGVSNKWIYSLGTCGQNVVLGNELGKILLSSDNGENWSSVYTGWSGVNVTAFARCGTKLVAGSSGRGVVVSSDSGASWTPSNSGLTDTMVNCLVSRGTNLFAGTYSGTFLSTDEGTTWAPANSGMTTICILSLAASGPNLFAGTLQKGAYESVDDGSHWSLFDTGLPTKSWVLSMAVNDVYIFSGTFADVYRRPLSEALPVQLSGLTACLVGSTVQLRWHTITEVNNYGFEIQRSGSNGQQATAQWNTIGFAEGFGTSNSPREYTFVDQKPPYAICSYRLKQIDRNGTFSLSNAVSVTCATTANETSLDQNYPNPFNASTIIVFHLTQPEWVTLKLYDALGREISVLVDGYMSAGKYREQYDAKALASGVYFCRLTAGSRTIVRAMLLMK